MTVIREILTTELKTETELTRAAITVKMSGSAVAASATELDGFLTRLHEAAIDAKVSAVVVDMRALELMSSSCFKQFVTWINTLQASAADAQYRVRFLADEKKHWQNRSLGALACFAVDLVRVEN